MFTNGHTTIWDKYNKLQELKIKEYDYKDLNYKIHLDAELRYNCVVFGRWYVTFKSTQRHISEVHNITLLYNR
jgi:hypothetical protein